METKLLERGWQKSKNVFGECLVCPVEERKKMISALAHSLLNWRITTNQSRTFSPMEILAIAISDNANQIAYAIRADLSEETQRPTAVPVIDEQIKGKVFVSTACKGYVRGMIGSNTAIEEAQAYLEDLIKQYLAE
jgi:hypothetical protein